VFDCSGTHGDSTAKVRTLFNYPKRIRAMKAEVAEKGRGAKAEAPPWSQKGPKMLPQRCSSTATVAKTRRNAPAAMRDEGERPRRDSERRRRMVNFSGKNC
jgi:hypothetical protein